MRETILRGLDDGLDYSFGGDVEIIVAVARHPNSKSRDALTSECTLSGKELIDFINEHAPKHADIIPDIVEGNMYKLTAYDW